MIRAMHRRLALLLAGVIALILCLAAAMALYASEQQMTQREGAAFEMQLDALAQKLRLQRTVADADLARLEAEQRMIVRILDNGSPIAFTGAWRTATPRETLFEAAMAHARRAGVVFGRDEMLEGMRYVGGMRGDAGERYLIGAACLSDFRAAHAIVLLQDMRAQDEQRALLRWRFAGIVAAALLLLSAFGWFFTGWTLRPLEAAHRKQNEFIAAASHEIRTPLSVMQTSLDALKAHPRDPDRFVLQIESESRRVAALTADLLLLTALRLPARGAVADPVEPRALIKAAQAAHRQAALAKSIELRASFEDALPLVAGDALRLQRAYFALVDNAIEYTPPGGTVALNAAQQGNAVVLSVRDDGPGIAPAQQGHIFERFYRGERREDGRAHSGLGLSIAREIVESHGGRLAYAPVQPHGSLFTMRLPCVKMGRGQRGRGKAE